MAVGLCQRGVVTNGTGDASAASHVVTTCAAHGARRRVVVRAPVSVRQGR